jgi:hypothetical protein
MHTSGKYWFNILSLNTQKSDKSYPKSGFWVTFMLMNSALLYQTVISVRIKEFAALIYLPYNTSLLKMTTIISNKGNDTNVSFFRSPNDYLISFVGKIRR